MEHKPTFQRHADAMRGMKRLAHHSSASINSPVAPSKSPPTSGGHRLSRKYYVTAVKEAPEIARHRSPILNDQVRVSSDTHPRWDERELLQREAKNAGLRKS
jgi:hypothetical protein